MNAKEIAYERDARGVCIICEAIDSNRRLGLCVKHYTRFRTTLRKIPAESREGFESHLVELGLLMPRRQGPRVDPREDVFAEEAKKYFEGIPIKPVIRRISEADPQQLAEHMVNHASEEPPIEKAPKKGRAGGKKKAQRRKQSEKLAERADDVASDDGMPNAPSGEVGPGSSPDESKGRAGGKKSRS